MIDYISKDNEVNCILREIQFDRVVGDCKDIMKKSANKYFICYPRSYQNQNNRLGKIIKDNKGKSFFYNPSLSFDDEPKTILNAFIDFILKCEQE